MADNRSLEEFDIYKDERRRKNIVIASVIGVLVVCLVIVAVLAGTILRSGVNEAESIGESITPTESEPVVVADTSIPFSLCEDSQIIALAQSYFDARLNADSSTINTLFGRSDTSPDETLKTRLEDQAGWIQGFNDITVYTVPGTGEDETLCLVTYVIDFRRTDAMAPGVMYFYAEKAADGTYSIAETLPKEKVDYANAFLSADSASAIIDSVDEQLSEALAGDSTLALIYTAFLNGDIYTEAALEPDREPDVDIVYDASDSVLVGESDLANMSREAAEAASREAAENAADSLSYASQSESPDQVDDTMGDEGSQSSSASGADGMESGNGAGSADGSKITGSDDDSDDDSSSGPGALLEDDSSSSLTNPGLVVDPAVSAP